MSVQAGWVFVDFAARSLARLLPYQKRGFFSVAYSCEYVVVRPMDAAAFMIGAALGLADRGHAELALSHETGFGDWVTISSMSMEWRLDQCVQLASRADVSFDDLYFDATGSDTDAVLNLRVGSWLDKPGARAQRDVLETLPDSERLSPDECVAVLERHVGNGIFFGLLMPKTSEMMLRNWIDQPSGKRRLGVRGLSVDSRPKVRTVEEAKHLASGMFADWARANPDALETAKRNLARHMSSQSFLDTRQALFDRCAGY